MEEGGEEGVVLTGCGRAFGSGSMGEGMVEVGVGRVVRYDDDKGMPDGVLDFNPSTHIFNLQIGPLPKVTCGNHLLLESTKKGYHLTTENKSHYTYPVPDI